MMRGSGEQEKMLKNAKTEYFNEHEEISTYLAIETFAEKVSDKETAKLARDIRREEERMAKFLAAQIKSLSGAVASAEVPAAQRRAAKAGASRRAKPASAKPASAKRTKASAKKARPARAKKAKASASRKPKAAARKAKSKAAPKRKKANASRKRS
jgi:rubrerythrin